ncbi:MAG: NERD domain-containing protein [Rhodospirillales bacterium]|nr:NERD domain-containing protein [Acetobacter sp.]
MTLEFWIFLGTWLASVGVLVGAGKLRRWRLARQKLRAPVAEKLLRAPGESLRRKLEVLEEDISSEVAVGFVLPPIYVGLILLQARKLPLVPWLVGIYTAVGLIGLGVICWRINRLAMKRQAYRLGLSGERAVGEELNQLMLAGCRVYHDVPNDPYGNIDHVLIAPSGVYAVETKTRRKKEGKDMHKAVFDGHSLRFVDGPHEHACLDQAKQQAGRLSDWLSKAVGEAVEVRPVLALPGWFVDRQGRGDVIVVSGKAVASLVKGRAVLDAAKITRIAHQLDQLCRDVEF